MNKENTNTPGQNEEKPAYIKPEIEESASFETLAASCSKAVDDGSGAPFQQLCMGGPLSAS